jgi:hypothetical protein
VKEWKYKQAAHLLQNIRQVGEPDACPPAQRFKVERLEPTSGLEPLTCRLRIGCSTN